MLAPPDAFLRSAEEGLMRLDRCAQSPPRAPSLLPRRKRRLGRYRPTPRATAIRCRVPEVGPQQGRAECASGGTALRVSSYPGLIQMEYYKDGCSAPAGADLESRSVRPEGRSRVVSTRCCCRSR